MTVHDQVPRSGGDFLQVWLRFVMLRNLCIVMTRVQLSHFRHRPDLWPDQPLRPPRRRNVTLRAAEGVPRRLLRRPPRAVTTRTRRRRAHWADPGRPGGVQGALRCPGSRGTAGSHGRKRDARLRRRTEAPRRDTRPAAKRWKKTTTQPRRPPATAMRSAGTSLHCRCPRSSTAAGSPAPTSRTGRGWLYLATVIDIASRPSASPWLNHVRTELGHNALAKRRRRPRSVP